LQSTTSDDRSCPFRSRQWATRCPPRSVISAPGGIGIMYCLRRIIPMRQIPPRAHPGSPTLRLKGAGKARRFCRPFSDFFRGYSMRRATATACRFRGCPRSGLALAFVPMIRSRSRLPPHRTPSQGRDRRAEIRGGLLSSLSLPSFVRLSSLPGRTHSCHRRQFRRHSMAIPCHHSNPLSPGIGFEIRFLYPR